MVEVLVSAAPVSPARRPPYAPRNALNAQRLREDIVERSEARGDAPPVRAWLLNHFLRHLVSNFEPARRIDTPEQAREACDSAVPEWLPRHFALTASAQAGTHAPLVLIDPGEPSLLALEVKLVEFLVSRKGTSLENKLDRINCPQAIALWDTEHAKMAARIEHGWRQSHPDATRTELVTASGRFVVFCSDSASLRSEMAFESYVMRHCVGQFSNKRALTGGYGEHYAAAVEEGKLRLISFRDARNMPHVTISVTVNANGSLSLDQVKGKQNRVPVARYIDDVIACLNHLETDDHIPADCISIGVVRTTRGWQRISEIRAAREQLEIVARHPALYAHLTDAKPVVEWMVAARAPAALSARQVHSAALRYVTNVMPTHQSMPDESQTVLTIEGVAWPGMWAQRRSWWRRFI